MKTLSYILFILLCLSSAPLSAQPLASVGKDTLFDFGKVYQGNIPVRHVTITNTGATPLHIENVDSPCGCTTTEISKYDLAPGDTTDLTIRFNSDHFVGEVKKYVIVVSNDLVHRNLFLRYHATVINVLQATPWYLYFEGAVVGREQSASLSLKNTTDTVIHVKDLSSLSGTLQLSIASRRIVPGDSTSLTVRFTPSVAVVYKDEIYIQTDINIQPKVKINLRAMVGDR